MMCLQAEGPIVRLRGHYGRLHSALRYH